MNAARPSDPFAPSDIGSDSSRFIFIAGQNVSVENQRRIWLRTAILAILMVAVLSVLALWPREPAFEGRRLTAWLDDLLWGSGPQKIKAEDAVRHIGTNAVPALLRKILTRDSQLKKDLSKLGIPLRADWKIRQQALSGFLALGAVAKPAVPGLLRLYMTQPGFSEAGDALTAIGPEPVLSCLTNLLVVQDDKTRSRAVYALATLNLPKQAVTPMIVQCLKDRDLGVRRQAILQLAWQRQWKQEDDEVLTALLTCLKDSDPEVRRWTTFAFGTSARSARISAALLQTLQKETDAAVRSNAVELLRIVYPEDAAKAGVR